LDIYWNILTMHGPINVKSPNNISEWQMGFNSAFKGLRQQLPLIQFAKSKDPCVVVILTAVNMRFITGFKEGAEIVCSVDRCTVLLKKHVCSPVMRQVFKNAFQWAQ